MIAKNPDSQNSVHFKIKRQDGPDKPAYWQTFDVPYKPNLNVISCLQAIAANPTTSEGQETTVVVWDCNCLEEVCGACTMVINGTARQSCSALIDQMREQGFGSRENPIVLEPMTKFPVVRDLWVDRSRMFKQLLRLKAWVPIDGTHKLGAGPKESPEMQDERYQLSRCMTCGCCLEACPQYLKDNHFIGANAIGQTLYFNEHETGKNLQGERLDVMMEPGGISDCGNAQNCVKVCPKEVPLTLAIAKVGRQVTVHAIKKFFMGK
ncbi:MAG: succinate dehydrogenase iron-sulfur subunit [Phycisphaera sp.]|nr:succinate dehydrogenase iron-sulfur subunit [Phycisphaera sp.]